MSPSVLQREKKPTAHQQRMREFNELAYQALRRYQRGEYAAACVAVGQLDPPLTAAFDAIKEAADRIFPHRSGGKKRSIA